MAAYMIAQIEIRDAAGYDQYRKQVLPTIQAFDGRVLAAEQRPDIAEGEWPYEMTVIIEWPSTERARQWYDSDEYAEPKALRKRVSKANLAFLRGLPR